MELLHREVRYLKLRAEPVHFTLLLENMQRVHALGELVCRPAFSINISCCRVVRLAIVNAED